MGDGLRRIGLGKGLSLSEGYLGYVGSGKFGLGKIKLSNGLKMD